MEKRVIKFRAWSPSKNEWLSSSDGDATFKFYEGFVSVITYEEYWTTEGGYPVERTKTEIHEDAIVNQFTGLLDKNGKEIYEGDIIKVPDEWSDYGMMAGEKRQVVFASGGFRFKSGNPRFRGHWLEDDGEFEVIGNIYENPDLLSPTK